MMQLTGHHIIPIPLMMSLITNRDRYNNAAFDNADRPTGVELQSRRRAQRATDYATDRVEECLIPRSWRSFSHFSPAMIHRRRLCEPPRPSLSGVPRGFVERNGRELSSPFSTISQLCARVIAAGAGAGGRGRGGRGGGGGRERASRAKRIRRSARSRRAHLLRCHKLYFAGARYWETRAGSAPVLFFTALWVYVYCASLAFPFSSPSFSRCCEE